MRIRRSKSKCFYFLRIAVDTASSTNFFATNQLYITLTKKNPFNAPIPNNFSGRHRFRNNRQEKQTQDRRAVSTASGGFSGIDTASAYAYFQKQRLIPLPPNWKNDCSAFFLRSKGQNTRLHINILYINPLQLHADLPLHLLHFNIIQGPKAAKSLHLLLPHSALHIYGLPNQRAIFEKPPFTSPQNSRGALRRQTRASYWAWTPRTFAIHHSSHLYFEPTWPNIQHAGTSGEPPDKHSSGWAAPGFNFLHSHLYIPKRYNTSKLYMLWLSKKMSSFNSYAKVTKMVEKNTVRNSQ